MVKRYYLIPVLLLTAGCAVRPPAAWRLTGQVLTPPGIAKGAFAAQGTSASDACPRDQSIQLDQRKQRLKVIVDRAALEKHDKGWLADWTDQCFDAGQRNLMAARVLESVPLTTGAGFRLMHADDIRAGFIDLGIGNRLEVISPILRPGADENAPLIEETAVGGTDRRIEVTLKASPNLVGHETAWYRFDPKPGSGARIAAISANASVRGIAMPLEQPAKNYFTFTGPIGFYRLFYKPEEETAVVVGAPSREQLPRDLAGCGKAGGPECITLPKRVGINPYLELSVNGKPLAVPAHMPPTIRAVIQAAKARPDTVLPTLAITKPYGGKPVPVEFDRTKQDILGLVLTGNEEIRW
jgi:hypothetical protein